MKDVRAKCRYFKTAVHLMAENRDIKYNPSKPCVKSCDHFSTVKLATDLDTT